MTLKSPSSKPPKTSTTTTRSPSSSLTTHLAMVELKQRILTSLSKLSDRDTHQIALEDLESTISTLRNDAVPMALNALFNASASDPKPAVRNHSLRLIASLSSSHSSLVSPHLLKISSHLSRCLRDSDKGVQIGAAMCLRRVVECANNPPVLAFQNLSPRLCKFLNSPNFHAKSALLPVVSILSRVGAILPPNLDPLLHSINECLVNSDWSTRKAAAETLTSLALHSTHLVKDSAQPTFKALEACRFDKIKPVRDSMVEALQQWKRITGKVEDGGFDAHKTSSDDPAKSGSPVLSDKMKQKPLDSSEKTDLTKDASNGDSSISDSVAKTNAIISNKTVGILKKKIPVLTDKELNPEFFQKLEKRSSNELPVELVIPQKSPTSSTSNEGEPEHNDADFKDKADEGSSAVHSSQDCNGVAGQDRWPDDAIIVKDLRARAFDHDDKDALLSKADGQSEGSFVSSKGNWLAIQRQVSQLERQQTHLMNMLQDFMGGSHDSMITLENRVRGLERVVEDMVHSLSTSSGRRGNNFMFGFDGSSSRNLNRYGGIYDYNGKFGRAGDGRLHFNEGIASGIRGRNPSRRSQPPDSWEFHSNAASRSGFRGSARMDASSNHFDDRSSISETEIGEFGGRRAWNKGIGLGEGPSARSVWQASKDEATLAAIRVAGDERVTTRARAARVAIPERTAEAIGNDGNEQSDPVRVAWTNAMDAVHMDDMESAYAEVLSIGDDFLLVKLMDRSGPVLDHLSNEMAVEVLNSISQLLMDQNLFDLCVSWIQQLVDFVMEDGPGVFCIPTEVRQELLFNLHEASSTMELSEEWEGATPEQLVLHLASTWNINLQDGN